MLERIDLSEIPWQEAMPQRQGDRELSVQLKIAFASPDRMVTYTHYDPDLVVAPHRHDGIEILYVLEGSMTIDGAPCPRGTLIVLDGDSTIGPIVAGAEGTVLLEIFEGAESWLPRPGGKSAAYEELVREREITELPGAGRS